MPRASEAPEVDYRFLPQITVVGGDFPPDPVPLPVPGGKPLLPPSLPPQSLCRPFLTPFPAPPGGAGAAFPRFLTGSPALNPEPSPQAPAGGRRRRSRDGRGGSLRNSGRGRSRWRWTRPATRLNACLLRPRYPLLIPRISPLHGKARITEQRALPLHCRGSVRSGGASSERQKATYHNRQSIHSTILLPLHKRQCS